MNPGIASKQGYVIQFLTGTGENPVIVVEVGIEKPSLFGYSFCRP